MAFLLVNLIVIKNSCYNYVKQNSHYFQYKFLMKSVISKMLLFFLSLFKMFVWEKRDKENTKNYLFQIVKYVNENYLFIV